MQILRLNGTQRVTLNSTEIDDRVFVEVDLFHTQPDGTETFMRMLLSLERAAALADALLAARDDAEPARLERIYG
jgi:hypothetical protein